MESIIGLCQALQEFSSQIRDLTAGPPSPEWYEVLQHIEEGNLEVENVVTSNTVWPNISDDKQGLAKYLCEKLPEICEDKRYLALNTAELMPNICDNHHHRRHLLLYRTSVFLPVYTGCQEMMTT